MRFCFEMEPLNQRGEIIYLISPAARVLSFLEILVAIAVQYPADVLSEMQTVFTHLRCRAATCKGIKADRSPSLLKR